MSSRRPTPIMPEQSEPISSEGSGADRRAWIRFPCDLGSSCRPSIGGDDMSWAARILDISQGGIRLLVERRFESRTILNIELEGENDEGPSSLLVRVVHVSAESGGQWTLGCRFARDLTDKELEELLKGRVP